MECIVATWIVALVGLVLIALLGSLQLVALVRPRAQWTIDNVYGGSPEDTDPTAYFAFNQATAWADPFLLVPLQVRASVGMLLGERWGFLLGLVASVPFWYTAISPTSGTATSASDAIASATGFSPGGCGRSSGSPRASTASSDSSTEMWYLVP